MTGVTLGYSWTQNYAFSDILNGGDSITVKGGGTLNYVIFFEGIGTIYSQPVDMSLSYSVN